MYCADLKTYIPDWPKSTGMTEQPLGVKKPYEILH